MTRGAFRDGIYFLYDHFKSSEDCNVGKSGVVKKTFLKPISRLIFANTDNASMKQVETLVA